MKKIRKFTILTCIEKRVYDGLVNKFSKGFTLIELLVVIAIIGVLAAGVFTAINPLKRIQQANDAKIKNDIGQIAQAAQAYFTSSVDQKYPLGVQALVDSKDLKVAPVAPTGSSYNITGTTADIAVWAPLTETGVGWFCWQSSTGVSQISPSEPSGATCPTTASTPTPTP